MVTAALISRAVRQRQDSHIQRSIVLGVVAIRAIFDWAAHCPSPDLGPTILYKPLLRRGIVVGCIDVHN